MRRPKSLPRLGAAALALCVAAPAGLALPRQSAPPPAARQDQPPGDDGAALFRRAIELQSRGENAEAVRAGEQGLAAFEKKFAPDAGELGSPLAILAGIYSMAGRFDEAATLYVRARAIHERVFGAENPLVTITLSGEALNFFRKGDYARAVDAYRHVLAVREKALGPEDPQVADTLTSLARSLEGKGDYAGAVPLLERALGISEKASGPDSANTAFVLDELAGSRIRMGDYAGAEPLARRAVAAREKALGPDDVLVAISLSTLGAALFRRGDYAGSERAYLRALAVTERAVGPESENAATVRYNLAILYDDLGRYDKARANYERAVAVRERALGPDHPEVAAALNALALLVERLGDPARGEELMRRAVRILEKSLGPDHPRVAVVLNNLGALHKRRGDYAGAEPLYRRALAVYENALGPEHPDVSDAVESLAILAHSKGDYAAARRLYARSLAIREKAFGPDHVQVGLTLNNAGMLALDTKDGATARRHFERALAIFTRALGPAHPHAATAVANLATLDLNAGNFASAERRFRAVLAATEKKFGADNVEAATPLNNLGSVYYDRGQYARAEPLYRRALALYENGLGPRHPNVAIALNNLAALSEAVRDIPRAVELTARANDVREEHLALTLVAGTEQQRRHFLELLAPEMEATVSLHVQLAPDDAAARDLALTTILRRKGRALDATVSTVEALRRSVAPQDRALVDELEEARSRLAALVLGGGGAAGRPEDRAEVERLGQRVERLEGEIGQRSAEFRAETVPATLEAVRAAVPGDAALVEFCAYRPYKPTGRRNDRFGARRYVAYVVTRGAEPRWADLGDAAAVDAAVEALRGALRDPKRADAKGLARALDESVMRPVRALLGEATRLLVAPDGALNLVPFAALVDERGSYLVERYAISYLTSGRDLLRPASGAGPGRAPVIVASPDYGAAEGGPAPATGASRVLAHGPAAGHARFTPLPGAEAEALELQRLLPGASRLTGAAATETALKALDGPPVLHVATHGFFLARPAAPAGPATRAPGAADVAAAASRDPLLRSGIALAGANRSGDGGEDGILTALEASGLSLRGTRLVVLSACDTGVGEVSAGEGVYGLRRALVLAGSESQALSLWPVSDAGTRELMVGYYRGMLAGAGRSDALRRAQLEMLASETHGHPYYWASFILSGQWGPLAMAAPPAAPPAPAAPAVRLEWAGGGKKGKKNEDKAAKVRLVVESGVAPGARALVDGAEAFPLVEAKDGAWVVRKGAASEPGGRTLSDIWSDGAEHEVVVVAPDGSRGAPVRVGRGN